MIAVCINQNPLTDKVRGCFLGDTLGGNLNRSISPAVKDFTVKFSGVHHRVVRDGTGRACENGGLFLQLPDTHFIQGHLAGAGGSGVIALHRIVVCLFTAGLLVQQYGQKS